MTLVQFRQLERSVSSAGSLISAMTLSAALASPLLLIGLKRSLVDVLFGVLLAVYLLSMGNAARLALRVIFSREGHVLQEKRGFFHYSHIRQHDTGTKFAEFVTAQPDKDQLAHTFETSWVIAGVLQKKASAIGDATRWTGVSLLLLGCLVVFRLIIALMGRT